MLGSLWIKKTTARSTWMDFPRRKFLVIVSMVISDVFWTHIRTTVAFLVQSFFVGISNSNCLNPSGFSRHLGGSMIFLTVFWHILTTEIKTHAQNMVVQLYQQSDQPDWVLYSKKKMVTFWAPSRDDGHFWVWKTYENSPGKSEVV